MRRLILTLLLAALPLTGVAGDRLNALAGVELGAPIAPHLQMVGEGRAALANLRRGVEGVGPHPTLRYLRLNPPDRLAPLEAAARSVSYLGLRDNDWRAVEVLVEAILPTPCGQAPVVRQLRDGLRARFAVTEATETTLSVTDGAGGRLRLRCSATRLTVRVTGPAFDAHAEALREAGR